MKGWLNWEPSKRTKRLHRITVLARTWLLTSEWIDFKYSTDKKSLWRQEKTLSVVLVICRFILCKTQFIFSRLLVGFRSDSALHKEMLAILAALTEVIKERGGSQTSTEYFLALVMSCICLVCSYDLLTSNQYFPDGNTRCCQWRQRIDSFGVTSSNGNQNGSRSGIEEEIRRHCQSFDGFDEAFRWHA